MLLTFVCLLPQVWIAPSTGVASAFLEQLEKISSDSTALMLAIFAVFALVHSGLAYLRPYGVYCIQTCVSSREHAPDS